MITLLQSAMRKHWGFSLLQFKVGPYWQAFGSLALQFVGFSPESRTSLSYPIPAIQCKLCSNEQTRIVDESESWIARNDGQAVGMVQTVLFHPDFTLNSHRFRGWVRAVRDFSAFSVPTWQS